MTTFDHATEQAPGALDIDGLRDAVVEVAQSDGAATAARLVEAHWDRYSSTHPRQLLAALRALPGEVFIDNPGLVVAANYLQQLATQSAPGRFESDPYVPGTDDPLAAQLIVLTGATAAERTRGNFAGAKKAALEARRRLDAASTSEVRAMRANLPHLFVQWGRSHEQSGAGGESAHFEYEEAHRLALLTNQPQIGRRAAAHLAWHLAERGRLVAAEFWLNRASETGEPNVPYDAPLHLAAALVHTDRNLRSSASADLKQLIAHPLGDYWAAVLWVKSMHARSAAERTLLESEIAGELARVPPSVSRGLVNARYIRAAWWRLGRLEAVPADRVLDSTAAYRRGDFHAVIERAHGGTSPENPPRDRAAALLLSAAAALGLGRDSAASSLFERAHAIIEGERMYTTYQLIDVAHLRELADGLGVIIALLPDNHSEGATGLLATLSKRERQVLAMLTSTRSLPAIAQELYVSPNTLKTTVQRMYRKLGVNSRDEAADVAHRAGLHVLP